MMLHDVFPDLATERQEYLRSIGRQAVQIDRGGVRSTPWVRPLVPGRIVEAVRGWLRPRPAPPLRGTA